MNIKLKNTVIGDDHPCFIIAELSANHVQDFDIAVKTIHAAKEAGADAVKIQAYTPDTMTIDVQNRYFKINHGTPWDGNYLYDLYKEAYTPWEWIPKLKEIVEGLGMIFFSSVFDKTSVDFLEMLDIQLYKIASFEVVDIPLIEYAASKRKPIIFSTGIASIDEIHDALTACRNLQNEEIAILKCTSSYPTPLSEVNLRTLKDMKEKFSCEVGLSDHSLSATIPAASVALGANIIEKHLILDRSIGGADSGFSMEAEEFKQMVKAVREIEEALGKVSYQMSEKLMKSRDFKRSLFVVADMEEGEIISEENVKSIRPGYGLSPKYLKEIIGKRILRETKKGIPLQWEMIEGR